MKVTRISDTRIFCHMLKILRLFGQPSLKTWIRFMTEIVPKTLMLKVFTNAKIVLKQKFSR